ncbi:hypothetical protein RI444_15445 [Paenarthrobacter sp. AT5]|uniref:hypothetical protein n=1 Tax=Paenarthrobacter TaxID=1742992 RepID=UPI001A98A40D|nr:MULTISPECIES: hypothetical protein [Paenarthrobacter]QSZ53273.1 hypothetical protein AYX19_09825 [Paenarthrobacter ureafaciens]WOC59902.1 hypothetical protein RI444_15445 [Paenarthrobacter sp. AT5]
MPKFTKDGLTLETSLANEIRELRARGFVEEKGETPALNEGGELPSGPVIVTNDTGRAEGVKPASKSTK